MTAAPRSDGGAGTGKASGLPESCTRSWITYTGLVAFFACIFLLRDSGLTPADQAAGAMAAAVLPIAAFDLLFLKVHRRPSTGLSWTALPAPDFGRLGTKLLGLIGTLGAVAGGYWILPEYHAAFYEPFWQLLGFLGPWALAAAIPYFAIVDRRMREPRDAYWHVGRLLIGRFGDADWAALGEHARGWIIKGFFLPLMFVYLSDAITDLQAMEVLHAEVTFTRLYDFGWALAFAVDLVFAAAGYVLTFRLIDAHLRSTEPTLFGWGVAIVCYEPFWSLASSQYLQYDDNLYWGLWLSGFPLLHAMWGTAILFLVGVYAWATVMFGCRFSNLTHRGILTNGPYRYTKHPAYIAKNLSWWLISIPFLSTDGAGEAIRNCLLLLAVNLLYWARARTEENHLSWDPTYRAYAQWMNEHGMFRWVGRAIPALRYVPPLSRGSADRRGASPITGE